VKDNNPPRGRKAVAGRAAFSNGGAAGDGEHRRLAGHSAFNGSAPGFVGLLQLNASPAGVASGNVPVTITVGTVASQPGVTMAVK